MRGTRILNSSDSPASSMSMWSKVPGVVIRSPTNSAASTSVASARSALVVIGCSDTNACRLTAVNGSGLWFVTVPVISIGPFSGRYDGVRPAMVTSRGSRAARARTRAVVAARAWDLLVATARSATDAASGGSSAAAGAPVATVVAATATRAGSSDSGRSMRRL